MEPKFFDIHAHVNHPDFDSDWEGVVKRCLDNGIGMIVVGNDLETSKKSIKIAEKYKEGVYATIGLHPTDHLGVGLPSGFKELAKHPKVVAIGECGLDFLRDPEARNSKSEIRNKQIDLFKQQIELAIELDKPLVIHCREAHEDVLSILASSSKIHGSRLRGDLHFFSGSVEQAKKYIELGFLISFTGVITFPLRLVVSQSETGAREYEEVIKNIPLEKMMIETDSPFVAPVPYRGKRNEPAFVVEVAKKIAEIRGESLEVVAKTTTQNALKLFGLI